MGYKHGRDRSGDTRSYASGDLCESNTCDGLVQPQALEGMEKYFFIDWEECKGGRIGFIGSGVDGDKESVVGVSDGHTIIEGGMSACLGNNLKSPQCQYYAK